MHLPALLARATITATALVFFTTTATATAGSQAYLVPFSQMNCTGSQLEKAAVEDAKDRFIEWGVLSQVEAGTVKWMDDKARTVSWWICNCKTKWDDGVVPDELDSVLHILRDECGAYRSGWVWSEDWDKGWTVERIEARLDKMNWELCPPCCVDGLDRQDSYPFFASSELGPGGREESQCF